MSIVNKTNNVYKYIVILIVWSTIFFVALQSSHSCGIPPDCDEPDGWSLWALTPSETLIARSEYSESVQIYSFDDTEITLLFDLAPYFVVGGEYSYGFSPSEDWGDCIDQGCRWSHSDWYSGCTAEYMYLGHGSDTVSASHGGWTNCDGVCGSSISGGGASLSVDIDSVHDLGEDIDGDGIHNAFDNNDDNDGYLDAYDSQPGGPYTYWGWYPYHWGGGDTSSEDGDMDQDGVPDSIDLDLDGDDIPNSSDNNVDGDSQLNGSDSDDDNDGIPDGSDPTPQGPTGSCTAVTPTTIGPKVSAALPKLIRNGINDLADNVGYNVRIKDMSITRSRKRGTCCNASGINEAVFEDTNSLSCKLYAQEAKVWGEDVNVQVDTWGGYSYTFRTRVGVFLTADVSISGSITLEEDKCEPSVCYGGSVGFNSPLTLKSIASLKSCFTSQGVEDCQTVSYEPLSVSSTVQGSISYSCNGWDLDGSISQVTVYYKVVFLGINRTYEIWTYGGLSL